MPNSSVSLLSNRLLASEDCDGEVLYLSEPFSAGLWSGLSTRPCGTPVASVCCASGVTSSFTLQLWCLPFCISPFTRLSALLSTNRSFFGGLSRSLPPSRKPLKMPGISARILLDSSRGSFASSAEGSSSVLLGEGDPALLPSISFPAFTWEGTSEGCSPCAAAGVGLVSGLFWQVGAFLGSRLGPELKQLSSFAAAITELGSFMSASHQESNNRESPANSDWPFWTSRPCLAISSWDGGVSSCPLQGIMGEAAASPDVESCPDAACWLRAVRPLNRFDNSLSISWKRDVSSMSLSSRAESRLEPLFCFSWVGGTTVWQTKKLRLEIIKC